MRPATAELPTAMHVLMRQALIRNPRRRLFVGGVLVLAALLGAGVATGVVGRRATALPPTVPVTLGSLTVDVDGVGTVAAAQTVDLLFPTSGTVAQVLVQEGDVVAARQPIAHLDDRLRQSQVTNAEANLTSARAGVGR